MMFFHSQMNFTSFLLTNLVIRYHRVARPYTTYYVVVVHPPWLLLPSSGDGLLAAQYARMIHDLVYKSVWK